MVAVRTLKVFVECDPSHDIFKGFRIGKNFFTEFAAELLEGIILRLPALDSVEYDGWPSVMREGPLMKRLIGVARKRGKKTSELGIFKNRVDGLYVSYIVDTTMKTVLGGFGTGDTLQAETPA